MYVCRCLQCTDRLKKEIFDLSEEVASLRGVWHESRQQLQKTKQYVAAKEAGPYMSTHIRLPMRMNVRQKCLPHTYDFPVASAIGPPAALMSGRVIRFRCVMASLPFTVCIFIMAALAFMPFLRICACIACPAFVPAFVGVRVFGVGLRHLCRPRYVMPLRCM